MGLHRLSTAHRVTTGVLSAALLLFLSGVIFAPTQACAEKSNRKPKAVDVVLLFDTSGSMLKTDPLQLRYQGAKQITEFLTKGDRLAIVGFSGTTSVVRALKPFSPDSASTVGQEIESIKTEGQHTDLFEAIKIAQETLEGDMRPGVERAIVLISDGKMEPLPDKGLPFARTLALVNDVLPVLKSKEIKVYTIALSEYADRPLLGEIAGATDGLSLYAANASELKQAFAMLFEAMVPTTASTIKIRPFFVDDSSEEATFYLTHAANSKISLVSPKGDFYTAAQRPDFIAWFAGEKFDMITVKEPDGGDWEVEGIEPIDSFATALTNLKLAIDWPILVRSEEPALLQARFYEGEKPVSLPDMSSIVTLSYQVIPTDSISPPIIESLLNDEGKDGDKVARDGIFSRLVSIRDPGEYRIVISSKSPTFDRTQHVQFRVKPQLIVLRAVPGQHPEAIEAEHAEHSSEPEASNHPAAPRFEGDEHWSFQAELSKEVTSFKDVEVSLIARSAEKKRFEIPLRRSVGNPLEYEVSADALPKDGTYTVYAELHGLTKSRQPVQAETEPMTFTRKTSPQPRETSAKVVVRETEQQPKPSQFPIASIAVITFLNFIIGIVAYLVIWKKPAVKSAPAPKYIPQKSLLDAIGELEGRVTQKEITLDDPIFERSSEIQTPQQPEAEEPAPSKDAQT